MLKEKIHDKFFSLLVIKEKPINANNLPQINNIPLLRLENKDWQNAASIAAKLNYRLVALWGQDLYNNLELNIILELQTAYIILRTQLATNNPKIPSITPHFPAANRLERHTQDMLGIVFTDHPDSRRWTRHQAWDQSQFPLRKCFSLQKIPTATTPPDNNYPFYTLHGTGVCEIPVGPVHAGIIEPGHFRFQIAGEDVISLEEHLGYTHKGIEKIAEGRDVAGLIKLAARVSGDSTSSFAWATCAALESALHYQVPARALYIRAIINERERVANHLGDFAAICNDVAYTFPYYQLTRLKELWLRLNAKIFQHRLLMDCIIPSGVNSDIDPQSTQMMLKQITEFRSELNEMLYIFEDHSGLHDRVKTTGILRGEQAKLLGVLGYVGRASGQKLDLRKDLAYPPYNRLNIRVPLYNTGDVLARLRVRFQEILASFDIIEQLLDTLPPGIINSPWETPKQSLEGVGLIEGWRGEVFVYLKLNNNGLVERFFPRDPSWFSWPALEQLIHGNIVPDFPVCNKSINGSYSGVDL